MNETMPDTLAAARRCVAAGLSVIPIRADGSKAPAIDWAAYQHRLPGSVDLDAWFGTTAVRGLGIVCGAISGGLEVLDFDDPSAYREWESLCADHDLGSLLERLPIVTTPSGGRHIYYRCADIAGNTKLARKADKHVRIETRGEGGMVVAPGSPAACHETRKPYRWYWLSPEEIPTITPEERGALHAMARILNEWVEAPVAAPRVASNHASSGPRPGDEYNARGDYEGVLERHGWTRAGSRGALGLWRRPGKNRGISATSNYADSRLFYVFSSNAIPFEDGKSYTPMAVLTLLEHGGDYAAATKWLAENGYGEPPAQTVQIKVGARKKSPTKRPMPMAPLTDFGNAERLVAIHGEDLRFSFEWNTWLIWDGRRWAKDKTGEITRRAKDTVRKIYAQAAKCEDEDERKRLAKHARDSESRSSLAAMVALAQSESGIPVTVDELDADRWALCCQNGTLDLRTGLLRDHDRTDMITKFVPVDYDHDAPCALWEAFLARVLPDPEVRAFVQRAVGYSLTGSVAAQCLFFLYGKGANGKSTLINTLLTLLSDYGMQAAPDVLIAKDRPSSGPSSEIAGLVGARLVATTEVDDGRRLAEGLVKQLTGGDRIRARFMHQEYFEFTPTHKLWFSANHKPVVRGGDEGIWRRIKMIPFEVTIPAEERDETLFDRLQAELPGILAWAVRGCLSWQEKGHAAGLAEPAAVRAATDAYRSEMDVLSAFVEECCVLFPTAVVTTADLYGRYLKWCEENSDRPLAKRSFTSRLQENHKVIPGTHIGPKKARGWIGVGLKSPDNLDIRDIQDVESHKLSKNEFHEGENTENHVPNVPTSQQPVLDEGWEVLR